MYVHITMDRGQLRIDSARDLGLYVRDRRRALAMTQADLASAAQVSRRWLADLEAGKATAEIGLAFRALHALGLIITVHPVEPAPDGVDLDELLRRLGSDQP
jgi:y4mF family transcriptional regulator